MKLLSAFFTMLFLIASGICGAVFYIVHNQCIDFSVLERYNPGKPTILLDDEGNEWARFQLDRREPITLSEMPPHLIQAFIAAEDWKFFEHVGISWRGIARSILVNLYHGKRLQGASTITQQLVKMLFLDGQKTLHRKVKEQLYALLVERQFSKEQILQTYLNHIYFGCGIYGVQAACQRFWGVHVSQISVDQAAMLAGIVRSPAQYCPILAPESAGKRRDVILHSMRKLAFISEQEYQVAKSQTVQLHEVDKKQIAPHVRETIRLFLEQLVGKDMVYSGGLIVQTTLNRSIQQQAEKSFKEQCAALKSNLMPEVDGALISMDVKTGDIKALVGGYDFATSKFNRALQAKRQIGSIFKPLIYAAAMQQGKSFADIEVDEPLELPQHNGTVWSPRNYNKQFNGPVTLAYGLSHSSNIVAIKTLLAVGMQPVIDLAKASHISGICYPYPSLALGCVDTTLLEVAGMFNIFANGGVYVEPHVISWVKDEWGAKIWKATVQKNRVLSFSVNSKVAKILMLSLERIKRFWKGKWLDSQAMNKTGTTNDSRMCWYVGSTPELTTAVYIGCDNNKSMGEDIFPFRTAFPVWIGVHSAITCSQKHFVFDPSLHEVTIDEKTGKQVSHKQYPGAVTILV